MRIHTQFLTAAGLLLLAAPCLAGLEIFEDADAFHDAIDDLGPVVLEDFESTHARFLPDAEFAACVEPVDHRSSDGCFAPDALATGYRITSSEGWGVIVPNRGILDAPSLGVSAWPYRVSPPTLNFTTVTFDPPVLAVAADVFGFKIEDGVPNGDPVAVEVEAFAADDSTLGSFTLEPEHHNESVFAGLRSDEPVARVEFGTRVEIAGEMIDNLRFAGTPGRLAAAPPRVAFGAAALGAEAEAADLDLSNAGFQPLTIDGLESPDAPFAIDQDDCSGETLEPGESCAVAVAYAPQAEGSHRGRLLVAAGDRDLEVDLAGHAELARLSVAPAQLDFGTVAVGEISAPETFELANARAVAVTVESLEAPGAPFVIDSGCPQAPFTLDPGDACTVEVRFEPQTADEFSAGIDLGSSGFSATGTIALRGTGSDAATSRSGGSSDHE